MTRSAHVAVLAVVAASLLVAGCGGGDDEKAAPELSPAQARAFMRAYRPISTDLLVLKVRYRGVTEAIQPDTGPGAASRFAGYAREMRALANRTSGLRAPEALREPRDRLSDFMGAVSRDLANLAAAARRGDQAAATNALENARAHSQGLDRAQAELETAAR